MRVVAKCVKDFFKSRRADNRKEVTELPRVGVFGEQPHNGLFIFEDERLFPQ